MAALVIDLELFPTLWALVGGARCGDIPNQSLLDPIHIFAKVVRWQVRVKVVMLLLFRAVIVKFDSDASVIYPTFSFG